MVDLWRWVDALEADNEELRAQIARARGQGGRPDRLRVLPFGKRSWLAAAVVLAAALAVGFWAGSAARALMTGLGQLVG